MPETTVVPCLVRGNRRALVLFLDAASEFRGQLNWLLESWRFSGSADIGDGTMDVFISVPQHALHMMNSTLQSITLASILSMLVTSRAYVLPANQLLSDLPTPLEDCTNWETSPYQEYTRDQWSALPGQCFFVVEPSIVDAWPDFLNYGYMNSIGALVQKAKEPLLQYGAILRMDLDTFVTPRFTEWFPVDAVYCGVGAYSGYGKYTRQKLLYIAKEMGVRHLGDIGHNVGSTWYGPSEDVIALGELTLEMCRYLIVVEFPHNPCWRFRSSLPQDVSIPCHNSDYEWGNGFYPGVTLLYGSEIAINHIWDVTGVGRPQKSFASRPGTPLFDCPTGQPLDVCETVGLHTFHSDDKFSKFAFSQGLYNGIDASAVSHGYLGLLSWLHSAQLILVAHFLVFDL
jgi:hypothetical protein